MPSIKIKFKECEWLYIDLYDSTVCKEYVKLLRTNLERQKPIFRDPARYTKSYMQELCVHLKSTLGWNWLDDDYSIENTTRFHKDIEELIDKEGDFQKIDGETQNLIHEAHFCIHTLQYKNPNYTHGYALQLEWFNDDYTDLPDDAIIDPQVQFGDVILQNAYVGHPPIQCYQQNDFSNIERTCAFPDRIKPGIKINLMPGNDKPFDWKKYKDWWFNNCRDYVEKVGIDTIEYYTGFTKLGSVRDKQILKSTLQKEVLDIEQVEIV